MVVVMMVVMRIISTPIPIIVERIVAHIPVPIIPRVVGITPHRVVEWIHTIAPAIVPWRSIDAKGYICSTPRAEHRGDVLRLHPYLITRHHNVVV
jgi:hypothetical protein